MLTTAIQRDRLHVGEYFTLRVGEHFTVSFQRTLRIPDDGRTYPLPPGLGTFPILAVNDFAERVPPAWLERDGAFGAFIPMYQREALWLGFGGAAWRPNAVKVGVGRVNAVSGEPWDERLHDDPQDYLVCPDQPWLDGINAGEGFIRQFVAMPLGQGYSVEAEVTGREEFGGIQLLVFDPKAGRFPDQPPPPPPWLPLASMAMPAESAGSEMGIGAGGRMRQKIYPDAYGIDTWDRHNRGTVNVYIVNSAQYQAIAGHEPPPSPIDAQTYTQYGLPWFDLYDEARGDLTAPERLARVRSIKQQEDEQGIEARPEDISGVDVPDSQVRKLHQGGTHGD